MTREFILVSYEIPQQKLLKKMSLIRKDSRTFQWALRCFSQFQDPQFLRALSRPSNVSKLSRISQNFKKLATLICLHPNIIQPQCKKNFGASATAILRLGTNNLNKALGNTCLFTITHTCDDDKITIQGHCMLFVFLSKLFCQLFKNDPTEH